MTKVLYLPIIEPGRNHEVALLNKRGLLDALRHRCGHDNVCQVDYLAIHKDKLFNFVVEKLEEFRPDLLLTQLHGADCLTPVNLSAIRGLFPSLIIANWSGDSHLHGLTAEPILEMCKYFDIQLIAAPDVLPIYAKYGIRAGFWQIAYEAPVGPLPDTPSYDVVFLGNVISDKRRALLEFLRGLKGISVGIYGDWEKSDGECTYDFGKGEALYKNAKIAIADNSYKDQVNYTSNRPIQIMMAGGAMLLHEYVPKMVELLGIEKGKHYEVWSTFDQLEMLIHMARSHFTVKIETMVKQSQAFTQANHTYDVRVKQLFEDYLHL